MLYTIFQHPRTLTRTPTHTHTHTLSTHTHTHTHAHTHTHTHARARTCCIGVPQLVVLVTDGQDDTDPVRKKATEMKDVDNIHIMTVGFGTLITLCRYLFVVIVIICCFPPVSLVCVRSLASQLSDDSPM